MIKSRSFIYTLIISFILGLIPTIIYIIHYGFYPKIPIEIMDDTLYYLGRVREVVSGHYFIGNSYLFEHTGDVTTAFFVADWIYSVPFLLFKLLKLPFYFGIIFSEIIWTIISSVLFYIIYKKFDIEDKYLPFLSAISLLSVIFFIYRPVTMSVVYPVFLLFLISLFEWLRENSKKNRIFLIASSVLSFYVYTYLWQMVLVSLGLTFVYILYSNSYIKDFLRVAIIIFLLSTPVFIYTFIQINSDYYFETLNRVGLVNTHGIGVSGFYYSLILLIITFILFLLNKRKIIDTNHIVFFSIISLSLLITGLSNVITGKDLEVAVHVGRFTDLFTLIFFVYMLSVWNKNKKELGILIMILTLSLLFPVILLYNKNIKTLEYVLNAENHESYSAFIDYLNLDKESRVILTNDTLGSYIPIMTNDYLVFHPNAELYLASNKEIEERYLVSRIFDNLTEDQLKSDYRKYAGVGNAVHQANVINRNVKMCLIYKKIVTSTKCGEFTDSYSLKGEKYFDGLLDKYNKIKKTPNEYFKKYNVKYILADKNDEWVIPRNLKLIWSNENFYLYKF